MAMGQYLDIFIDEAREHIQTLNDSVLVLEQTPDDKDTVNEIFRAAHSLKGISGSMGFTRLQRLTHDMESVFSEVRDEKISVDSGIVDVLFQCLDAIEGYIDKIVNTQSEGDNDNEEIINRLNQILGGKDSAPKGNDKQPEQQPENPAGTGTSLCMTDIELEAVKEAEEDGMSAYAVTVYIDQTCLLKSVRAFMLFKSLEGKGEIIKINPSVQDIEDEKFEFEFSMILISELTQEELQKLVLNVSEIEKTDIEKIDTATYQTEEMRSKAGAEGPAESGSKDVTQAEEKEKEQGAKPAKPEDKQAAKPKKKTVVNHSVRVDIEKLDDLMNLVSEMIIAKNAIISAGEELYADKRNSPEARNYKQQMEYMERITSSIHESVMRVRMVPIESVINRFPRMIRDIAKKLDKEIQLIITGEDTELDRTVIDEIGDPLMHMLRNAADHGLEMPDDREKAGKPRLGTIWIEAGQQGDNVLIRVRDDGAGIDVNKVRKKAMEKGQITQEEAAFMTDNDVVQLLFKPSFSTAEKVSDLSGRGVGLDVVKSKIEGLGGDVTVETELGKGSTFIIRLPLTLAIIKALMVYIHDEVYAIPLGLVSTVELMPRTSVNYIQDRPFINLRDEVIPLLFMREYFQLPEQEAEDSRDLVVVIVKKGLKSLGIVVDDFIGQQEVVVKPIGNYINPPKAISGSTILGNGNVALILDANALI